MTLTRAAGGARVVANEREYLIELDLPADADADHVKVFPKPGALEIHAPRPRHQRYAINPNAEAC